MDQHKTAFLFLKDIAGKKIEENGNNILDIHLDQIERLKNILTVAQINKVFSTNQKVNVLLGLK